MTVKMITLRERSRQKKSKYYMIPFKQISCHLGMVGQAGAGGRDYKVINFESNGYVHYIDCLMVSWLYT